MWSKTMTAATSNNRVPHLIDRRGKSSWRRRRRTPPDVTRRPREAPGARGSRSVLPGPVSEWHDSISTSPYPTPSARRDMYQDEHGHSKHNFYGKPFLQIFYNKSTPSSYKIRPWTPFKATCRRRGGNYPTWCNSRPPRNLVNDSLDDFHINLLISQIQFVLTFKEFLKLKKLLVTHVVWKLHNVSSP